MKNKYLSRLIKALSWKNVKTWIKENIWLAAILIAIAIIELSGWLVKIYNLWPWEGHFSPVVLATSIVFSVYAIKIKTGNRYIDAHIKYGRPIALVAASLILLLLVPILIEWSILQNNLLLIVSHSLILLFFIWTLFNISIIFQTPATFIMVGSTILFVIIDVGLNRYMPKIPGFLIGMAVGFFAWLIYDQSYAKKHPKIALLLEELEDKPADIDETINLIKENDLKRARKNLNNLEAAFIHYDRLRLPKGIIAFISSIGACQKILEKQKSISATDANLCHEELKKAKRCIQMTKAILTQQNA